MPQEPKKTENEIVPGQPAQAVEAPAEKEGIATPEQVRQEVGAAEARMGDATAEAMQAAADMGESADKELEEASKPFRAELAALLPEQVAAGVAQVRTFMDKKIENPREGNPDTMTDLVRVKTALRNHEAGVEPLSEEDLAKAHARHDVLVGVVKKQLLNPEGPLAQAGFDMKAAENPGDIANAIFEEAAASKGADFEQQLKALQERDPGTLNVKEKAQLERLKQAVDAYGAYKEKVANVPDQAQEADDKPHSFQMPPAQFQNSPGVRPGADGEAAEPVPPGLATSEALPPGFTHEDEPVSPDGHEDIDALRAESEALMAEIGTLDVKNPDVQQVLARVHDIQRRIEAAQEAKKHHAGPEAAEDAAEPSLRERADERVDNILGESRREYVDAMDAVRDWFSGKTEHSVYAGKVGNTVRRAYSAVNAITKSEWERRPVTQANNLIEAAARELVARPGMNTRSVLEDLLQDKFMNVAFPKDIELDKFTGKLLMDAVAAKVEYNKRRIQIQEEHAAMTELHAMSPEDLALRNVERFEQLVLGEYEKQNAYRKEKLDAKWDATRTGRILKSSGKWLMGKVGRYGDIPLGIRLAIGTLVGSVIAIGVTAATGGSALLAIPGILTMRAARGGASYLSGKLGARVYERVVDKKVITDATVSEAYANKLGMAELGEYDQPESRLAAYEALEGATKLLATAKSVEQKIARRKNIVALLAGGVTAFGASAGWSAAEAHFMTPGTGTTVAENIPPQPSASATPSVMETQAPRAFVAPTPDQHAPDLTQGAQGTTPALHEATPVSAPAESVSQTPAAEVAAGQTPGWFVAPTPDHAAPIAEATPHAMPSVESASAHMPDAVETATQPKSFMQPTTETPGATDTAPATAAATQTPPASAAAGTSPESAPASSVETATPPAGSVIESQPSASSVVEQPVVPKPEVSEALKTAEQGYAVEKGGSIWKGVKMQVQDYVKADHVTPEQLNVKMTPEQFQSFKADVLDGGDLSTEHARLLDRIVATNILKNNMMSMGISRPGEIVHWDPTTGKISVDAQGGGAPLYDVRTGKPVSVDDLPKTQAQVPDAAAKPSVVPDQTGGTRVQVTAPDTLSAQRAGDLAQQTEMDTAKDAVAASWDVGMTTEQVAHAKQLFAQFKEQTGIDLENPPAQLQAKLGTVYNGNAAGLRKGFELVVDTKNGKQVLVFEPNDAQLKGSVAEMIKAQIARKGTTFIEAPKPSPHVIDLKTGQSKVVTSGAEQGVLDRQELLRKQAVIDGQPAPQGTPAFQPPPARPPFRFQPSYNNPVPPPSATPIPNPPPHQ